ncbi:MAG TPA: baseplate J/gp47 family protein, partial [Patescibacteria group bacterium]|nr:baseplate J/gp47 family protein [Patescibacteria group bacterium]
SHEEFFPASLEDTSLDNLIDLVDKTISRAEEILPPDIETHKTVFGVKDDWVEQESKKIKKDYLTKLKKICDTLDLTPIGFMVITEAISHLLQDTEGAPLSAILGDIGKKSINLTLFRGGKVIERISGPLHDSAPQTTDNLLKHFTTVVLPAKIILYDGNSIEDFAQTFISHQWSKALPFLHVPQIVTLPHGFDAKAVTFGAAAQLGFEVVGLDLTMDELKENKLTPNKEESKEIPLHEDLARQEEKAEETNEEESLPSQSTHPSTITTDNFGFVMDEDIATKHPQNETESEDSPETHDDLETQKSVMHDNFTPVSTFENDEEEYSRDHKQKPLFGFLAGITLPRLSLPGGEGKKKFILPIAVVIGIIIFISIFTAYYFNNVQAHIVLSVKPEIVNQEETVVFSDEENSDFAKNIIAAKSLETDVDGSLSIPTTGKKDVGEKAKGTVTIYNNADKSITLDAGSSIKSSNGLTFILDKSVSVASASGDIFSGTKPGTANVAVTAQDIGTEGNLPSGTKFSIGSTSTLAAKNDSAFSGGTKKQIQVVSKNDIAKLRTELPKSLEEKATEAITQQAGSEETILPFINVVQISKENFDNDVDDEAKTVKLTATVSFVSLAYNNDDLNKYAASLFRDKYSQDINEETIKTLIEEPEENDDEQIAAKLSMEAGLLPDINTNDVAQKIESLSRTDAEAFLNALPQVEETKINFSPGIPFIFNIFPRLPNHITLEIQAE